MTEIVKIISPIDDSVIAERELVSDDHISKTLNRSIKAKSSWNSTDIKTRANICHRVIDCMISNKEEIAKEITLQIGRPIQYSESEILGVEERSRYMIDIAEQELQDINIEDDINFKRYIQKDALGVVLIIAPWNYPYLTAINSIIPALMAGNVVLLKHSAQTLLCAERFKNAFDEAGAPSGVFNYLHMDHDATERLIKNKSISYVAFTGSVAGGKKMEEVSSGLFKNIALELGGKDPAYVFSDADVTESAKSLVDGAFFNSGQSCCGIERIYVNEDVYDQFLEVFIDQVNSYKLGNPLEIETTLGPMVNTKSSNYVRTQIEQAVNAGAIKCIDEAKFTSDKKGTPYLAPQVLINVDHNMSIMKDESFGPVVGIMKVSSDEQAIELMNDSVYGLTASLWTNDVNKAMQLGDQIDAGTVYMNRCDYLDPALAWSGVKQSGRACSLSKLAYQQFTRPKSFHLKANL